MTKFNAVIFDLFGTIVDGFAASSVGYQEQFAAALGVPHEQLSQHWRQLTDRRTLGEFQTVQASIEHVCGIIGATVTAEQMMKAVEIRLSLTRHALTPRPDAVATFASMRTWTKARAMSRKERAMPASRLAATPTCAKARR